jgi:hypothetical protein
MHGQMTAPWADVRSLLAIQHHVDHCRLMTDRCCPYLLDGSVGVAFPLDISNLNLTFVFVTLIKRPYKIQSIFNFFLYL